MNKILYQGRNITLKVREVVGLGMVLALILLLFGITSCEANQRSASEIETQKLAAIEDNCKLAMSNIKELDNLLNRADICSEDWYKDIDDYISRLKDQNELLKKSNDTKDKDLLTFQTKLLSSLEQFREVQNDESIVALQKSMKEYKSNQDSICKGETK